MFHRLTLVGVTVATAGVLLSAQANWQDVVRNLRNPDPQIRLKSTQQLGGSGYVEAAEPVAPLLQDPDDRVQAAAIEAELGFFLVDRIGGVRVMGFGGSKSTAQEAFGPAS